MNGRVAKKLRRQARNETQGNYTKDRIFYFTGKGEKFLAVDCARGYYQTLKKLYYYAKKHYKKMPKLQIAHAPSGPSREERVDVPEMRGILDIP